MDLSSQDQATLPRVAWTAIRAMNPPQRPQRTSCAYPQRHGRAGNLKRLENVGIPAELVLIVRELRLATSVYASLSRVIACQAP